MSAREGGRRDRRHSQGRVAQAAPAGGRTGFGDNLTDMGESSACACGLCYSLALMFVRAMFLIAGRSAKLGPTLSRHLRPESAAVCGSVGMILFFAHPTSESRNG